MIVETAYKNIYYLVYSVDISHEGSECGKELLVAVSTEWQCTVDHNTSARVISGGCVVRCVYVWRRCVREERTASLLRMVGSPTVVELYSTPSSLWYTRSSIHKVRELAGC